MAANSKIHNEHKLQ